MQCFDFFDKWLPVIFSCHQKPERSFFYHNRQFPICARCTGELVGIIFGFPFFLIIQISVMCSLVFLLPMLVDGFLQMLTTYESNNFKRFFTGFFFGYGLSTLFLLSNIYVYQKSILFWNILLYNLH